MKKVVGILALCLILFMNISFAAYAEESGEQTNYDGLIELISNEPLPEANLIDEDVYEIEKQIIIDKIIDGNVYVMAQDFIMKDATVYGNIYVMAQTIQIENSEIRGSIFVMGQKVSLAGTANDLYVMGDTVRLEETLTIWRSAKVGANKLDVKGSIRRNLDASVESLNIADSAVINGKLSYYAKQEGTISQMAQIGDKEFMQTPEEISYEKSVTDYMMEAVSVAFKTLIIALIIVFFVGKFKRLPRENAITDLLKSMGKGIGILILVPVLIIILILTEIGAALGVSLLAIYMVLLYIATTILALEIAYRILAKVPQAQDNKLKIIGIAIFISIVIWGIGLIPVIGGGIKFLLGLTGLGILWDTMFQKVKNESNIGEVNEN